MLQKGREAVSPLLAHADAPEVIVPPVSALCARPCPRLRVIPGPVFHAVGLAVSCAALLPDLPCDIRVEAAAASGLAAGQLVPPHR